MSFGKLTKIFGAGLLGYEALVLSYAFGWAVISPQTMIDQYDASLGFALGLLLFCFGGMGIIVAVVMLLSAWCILNFRRHDEKKGPNQPTGPTAKAAAHQ
jgi:hypothetical protein